MPEAAARPAGRPRPDGAAAHPLRAAVRAQARAFAMAALFSAVVSVLLLVPSLYSMQVYDRVLSSRNEMTLWLLSGMALALYAVMSLLDWARGAMLLVVSNRLDARLARPVFDAAFERTLRGGEGTPAQALGDLATVRQFVGGSPMHAMFDLPWMPIYLAALYLLHPLLCLYTVVGAALLLGLTALTEWFTAQPLAQAGMQGLLASQIANGTARHAEAVRPMGMLGALRRRWRHAHEHMLSLQSQASGRADTVGALTRFTRVALQSMALALGAWLVLRNEISAGAMFAASLLTGRATAPVEQMIALWRHLVTTRGAWQRLDELLTRHPAATARMELPRPKGLLTVEGVVAMPPASQVPVLRGVTLQARPGQIVGVIGASASGKSTLGRVMVGLWPPAMGHVRLDGADLGPWLAGDLGPHIGYLPQSIELIQGTVSENIARFGEVDADLVVRAARLAGVHDMILRLPQGYDTPIGPNGQGMLSGGQRQRVALARALYGNPALVVLDEPNSNLDGPGEAALHDALIGLKARQATVIVITQRNGVLALADALVWMQGGQVMAAGPRQDVLARLAAGLPAAPVPPVPPGPPAASGAVRPATTPELA